MLNLGAKTNSLQQYRGKIKILSIRKLLCQNMQLFVEITAKICHVCHKIATSY